MVAARDEIKHVVLERETSDLKERYIGVRQYTQEICKPLHTEDFVVQPAAFINPLKWHLAHTTWFFEEFILSKQLRNYKCFNTQFSLLFSSYSNSIGAHVLHLEPGNFSRPTVDEIFTYRQYVDEHMKELLDNPSPGLKSLVELGINHEQQHQELLFADAKFILGHNPLFPPYKGKFCETRSRESNAEFASIPQGEYSIGYSGYGFSYDNEQSIHHVLLKPYRISKTLIRNDEYLQFMWDGGYEQCEHWLDDGWRWVNENKIRAPLYWHEIDNVWHRYGLGGLEHVDPTEPVTHISFYEAAAFASWKGMRLPTEFEWEAAADQFTWGQRWEHTSSAYLPYPGYKKPEGSIGEYNGKFTINAMVLRGSSIVTPPNHSRKTYRNFCPPELRWQFTGIRLCRD